MIQQEKQKLNPPSWSISQILAGELRERVILRQCYYHEKKQLRLINNFAMGKPVPREDIYHFIDSVVVVGLNANGTANLKFYCLEGIEENERHSQFEEILRGFQ